LATDALEAIRVEKTIQGIATMYSIHPNLVGQWEKPLLESADKLSKKEGKGKGTEETERKEGELYKQIGQLKV